MDISVVVPCYRSEETLEPLVQRIISVLTSEKKKKNHNIEVLLVIDGSPDNTAEVAKKLSKKYPSVRIIELMKNYGQHNALLAGLKQAKGRLLVTIDDDLQHQPEDIPLLIQELEHSGADVVYACSRKEEHNFGRSLASRFSKKILKIAGAPTNAEISAFRVFRGELLPLFANVNNQFVSIDVVLAWGTSRFTQCFVEMHEREKGTSGYKFSTLVRYFITVLMGYSTFPLKMAMWVGLATAVFAVIFGVFTLINFFVVGSIAEGFTTIAILIAFLGGIQLFAIGIIGGYLGRLYMKGIGKPAYLIRQPNNQ